MTKYNHIDNAQTDFDILSSQLRELRKELMDIDFAVDFQLTGIDSTTRMIDFWFDSNQGDGS